MKIVAGLALLLALGACSEGQVVGRGAGMALSGLGSQRAAAQWHVAHVSVVVPHSLKVSEENVFVPMADIVWHGDPEGDRYAQVQNILDEAARRGTSGMRQGQAVDVQLVVERFHALTPKARYTFGGNFATRFVLTVRDARTGTVLDGPRLVLADCPAAGGQKALDEEAHGITQRKVIVDHVAKVLQDELSTRVVAPAVTRNGFGPADPDPAG